ncbi:winged helix-turn-helix transcriptional regulator [bacterium]|nr:winged helix-turn-helix transcriptional regulator [bacterium]
MRKNPIRHLKVDDLEKVALRFRCLGEVSRLRIVQSLMGGEKNVTEIVTFTGLSQPNVSRHLTQLVTSQLIAKRKSRQNVIYSIRDRSLAAICSIVCQSVKS